MRVGTHFRVSTGAARRQVAAVGPTSRNYIRQLYELTGWAVSLPCLLVVIILSKDYNLCKRLVELAAPFRQKTLLNISLDIVRISLAESIWFCEVMNDVLTMLLGSALESQKSRF